MAKKQFRFTAGIVVIVGAIIYFAMAGFEEGKAYYKTIDELSDMGESAEGKRLRVGGIVSEGTIKRDGRELTFMIEQEERTLSVHYVGTAPIPDTFKDGAEAIVEGRRLADGTFEADHIQAKCASKYEAEYGSGNKEGDKETTSESY